MAGVVRFLAAKACPPSSSHALAPHRGIARRSLARAHRVPASPHKDRQLRLTVLPTVAPLPVRGKIAVGARVGHSVTRAVPLLRRKAAPRPLVASRVGPQSENLRRRVIRHWGGALQRRGGKHARPLPWPSGPPPPSPPPPQPPPAAALLPSRSAAEQVADAARRNGYAPCTRRPPAGRCPHRPRSGHGRQGRHSKEGARLVLRGAAKRGAYRDEVLVPPENAFYLQPCGGRSITSPTRTHSRGEAGCKVAGRGKRAGGAARAGSAA